MPSKHAHRAVRTFALTLAAASAVVASTAAAHSDYTYARGERPLADFGMHPSEPEPLGDMARAFRAEHASAKKAAFVFEMYVAKKY